MTTRLYSSISQETTLVSALSAGATTMVVNSASALLATITPAAGETFTVVIDPDTALEEIVDVIYPSAPGSTTLTISRNIDSSTAIAHSAGAKVRHMAISRDFREANSHINGSLAQHTATTSAELRSLISDETGSGALVFGTSPTLSSPTITGTGAIAGTFTGNLTGNVTGNVSGSAGSATGNAATATALATGRTISLTGDVTGTTGTFDGTGNATMTSAIAAGVIVDADINAAAAITKTKISGTAITAADTGTVTSTMIADGTIVNGDINSSAQIAYSKTNLTNSIVDADVNASAAIAWSKIAPSSTVSTTELGYLDGVTSAIQTQLDAKLATATASSTYAPLASPALTGTPTAPTATAGTNTTQVATTAYVGTAISNLVAGAPTTLDTLDEIAAALADTANFSDTVVLKTGSTMSGNLAMGTNKVTGLGTPTVSTDAATKGYVDTVTVAPSNLTGPITSVGAATTVAAQTGTGSTFVMNTSPTLVTPVLGVATATSINGTTIPSSKTLVATDSTTYVVPSQTGNSGKALVTDGTTSSWSSTINGTAIPASKTLVATDSTAYVVPTQTGNSGKYLTTDGSTSSWGTVNALPSQTGNSGKYLTTDGSAASWATVTTDPTADIFMMMGA